MNQFLLVIAGPTAAGKTSLSISLAQHYHAEIISADARQFYREMNIGTAKPGLEELAAIPHHFINHLSIFDHYSAGLFENEATAFIEEHQQGKRVTLLVGGSGLFVRAVVEGFDAFPEEDPEVREKIKERFRSEGMAPLQELLMKLDPEYYTSVDRNNPQRLVRALTVCLTSGSPYSSFRKRKPRPRNFIPIKIGVRPDKEELHERISARVDAMMKSGLLAEAESLYPLRQLGALQTVGYTELFDFMEKKYSMQEAMEQIKRNTRQYAKRQMTWFRKDKEITWFGDGQQQQIIEHIDSRMAEHNRQ